MKTTVSKLIIASVIFITLNGCSFGTSMHTQLTSLNIGCSTKNIKISNARVDLNGAETWTAECEGKTYDCNYFPEADTNCYLREE